MGAMDYWFIGIYVHFVGNKISSTQGKLFLILEYLNLNLHFLYLVTEKIPKSSTFSAAEAMVQGQLWQEFHWG